MISITFFYWDSHWKSWNSRMAMADFGPFVHSVLFRRPRVRVVVFLFFFSRFFFFIGRFLLSINIIVLFIIVIRIISTCDELHLPCRHRENRSPNGKLFLLRETYEAHYTHYTNIFYKRIQKPRRAFHGFFIHFVSQEFYTFNWLMKSLRCKTIWMYKNSPFYPIVE